MTALNKFQKYLIIFLSLFSIFFLGFYVGKQDLDANFVRKDFKVEITRKDPPAKELDFALFWEVWDEVSRNYLEKPVDSKAMMYGAIQGMVSSLGDPYTSFLPPSENKDAEDSLNGTYEGIGAELGFKEEQIVVVSPFDGSPAKEAGIRPGDIIIKIGEESTFGLDLTEAVKKIRGAAGTTVNLTVGRDGVKEPFNVVIKRGRITVESVKWENKGEGIAYIRVSRFGEDTNRLWEQSVKEINVQMPELNAIVLDLRGNPGGYLDSAIFLAGEFFKDMPVIYEENSAGKQAERVTTRVGSFIGVPVVALIDGGSASASEILAAAVKDNASAVLVGEKSFGKGTIQDVVEFPDGSGVHITIAKWLTPKKEWVHKKGITPDKEVKISEEDIKAEKDPQLDEALETARNF